MEPSRGRPGSASRGGRNACEKASFGIAPRRAGKQAAKRIPGQGKKGSDLDNDDDDDDDDGDNEDGE